MLVSILTMYNNYPEIFSNFETPDHVDRQIVIDGICIDCAELELLYSDPKTLQLMIKNWTQRHLPVWSDLQETLEYKYNPIWNVEGSETMVIDREDKESRNLKDDKTRNDTETRNLTNKREPDLTTEESVSAYNSSDYTPRQKVKETGTETAIQTGTVGQDGREQLLQTGSIDNKGKETRTFTRGMNLGVMTTQQLIREQRELVQFTVSDYIINSFKETFCLMVY